MLFSRFDIFCDNIRNTCAVCLEPVNKNDPRVTCGHAYCVGCLKELFLSSMQDETLMPPRCCRQEIPIHLAKLNSKETIDFNVSIVPNQHAQHLFLPLPLLIRSERVQSMFDIEYISLPLYF